MKSSPFIDGLHLSRKPEWTGFALGFYDWLIICGVETYLQECLPAFWSFLRPAEPDAIYTYDLLVHGFAHGCNLQTDIFSLCSYCVVLHPLVALKYHSHSKLKFSNKLQIDKMIPSCESGKSKSSHKFQLCGNRSRKANGRAGDLFEYYTLPQSFGPKTIDSENLFRKAGETRWSKSYFLSSCNKILDPHFGQDYLSLFEIPNIQKWKRTLEESLSTAIWMPKDEDSPSKQLHSTLYAIDVVSFLSSFYETYLPSGYLKHRVIECLSAKTEDLKCREEILRCELNNQN